MLNKKVITMAIVCFITMFVVGCGKQDYTSKTYILNFIDNPAVSDDMSHDEIEAREMICMVFYMLGEEAISLSLIQIYAAEKNRISSTYDIESWGEGEKNIRLIAIGNTINNDIMDIKHSTPDKITSDMANTINRLVLNIARCRYGYPA